MSLTRRSFIGTSLAAAAGLSLAPRFARGAVEGHKLVVVFARGAWDPVWSIDPKDSLDIDSPPDGVVTTFNHGIDVLTHASRPNVEAFFATHDDACAVIRGINVGSIAHFASHVRMMTGTRTEVSPDIAAIHGVVNGEGLALPYADIGGGGYAGAYASRMGRVGRRNQIATLLDRSKALAAAPSADYDEAPLFNPGASERTLIANYRSQRSAAGQAQRGQHGLNALRFADYNGAFIDADALRQVPEVVGLKLGGSGSGLVGQIDATIALLKGTSCAAYLDPRLDFDSHDNIHEQGVHQNTLFGDLNNLIAALVAADLMAQTTVVVMSEMGRTPKLNGNQVNSGKDHWPVTSALVVGAAVKPGVYGATDNKLNARGINLATGKPADGEKQLGFDNFCAGVLKLVGVDPQLWLPNVKPITGFFT